MIYIDDGAIPMNNMLPNAVKFSTEIFEKVAVDSQHWPRPRHAATRRRDGGVSSRAQALGEFSFHASRSMTVRDRGRASVKIARAHSRPRTRRWT